MKSAKFKYFSNLIAKNHHISKALFSVINSVLNPPVNVISNPQCHYVKVSQGFSVIRLLLWDLSCNHLLMCHLNCVALQLYGVILIQFLSSLSKKLLTIWNLPSALLMFSLHLFKKKIDSVGPSLVSFMSKFLVSGTIPDSLKEATVTPLLKKSFLILVILIISNLPFITKALEEQLC